MKKIVFIISLFLVLSFSSMCFSGPGDTMKPSIDYTADALVRTGKLNLYSIFFVTDGVNDVTVKLYDSLSATGTTLVPTYVYAADANNLNRTISFSPPLQLRTGLYVDITTAGTVTYKVYFNLDNL
jgi:hypothetical protein